MFSVIQHVKTVKWKNSIINLYAMKKLERINKEKYKTLSMKIETTIYRITNANDRDHSVFVMSWMCPFSPKYLFFFLLVTVVAVITSDKCGTYRFNDRMIICVEETPKPTPMRKFSGKGPHTEILGKSLLMII